MGMGRLFLFPFFWLCIATERHLNVFFFRRVAVAAVVVVYPVVLVGSRRKLKDFMIAFAPL
jgi:hypothetical protein